MDNLLSPETINGLLGLTSVLITAFVGWLAPTVKSRLGVDMDTRARETLHSALNTGALIAWSRVTDHVERPTTDQLVQILLRHVIGEGAGAAVQRLNVSGDTLQNLATAKILEVGARLGHEVLKGKS